MAGVHRDSKRIAAFVPNLLGCSPGQRFRIEAWAELLRGVGWLVDFYPFEDPHLHEVLYKEGRVATKALRLASCYLRQFAVVSRQPACDVVYIYREMSLIGPALLERLAVRMHVPIVYDIDDPVFLPYRSPTSGWFSLLKFSRKTHSLIKRSAHVIAINRALGDYASKFNRAVTVIPNFVDTDRYCPPPRKPSSDRAIRLIWMGSHSTMPNLTALTGPLRRLQATDRVSLLVVGVGEADLPGVDFEMRQWSAASEVSDLQSCHIGLAPIPDTPWNRWKFFLKVVQYLSVGLPVVASRVGSNPEVIEDGVTGFLVTSENEWYDRLSHLVNDHALRLRMAAAARERAVTRYSRAVLGSRVLSTFESVLGEAGTW